MLQHSKIFSIPINQSINVSGSRQQENTARSKSIQREREEEEQTEAETDLKPQIATEENTTVKPTNDNNLY